MRFDLRMLFQVRQHDDEGDFFLIDHAPKILYCRFKGALRRNKQLIIPRDASVNKVGVDV